MEDTLIGAFVFLMHLCVHLSVLTLHISITTLFLRGPFYVNLFA